MIVNHLTVAKKKQQKTTKKNLMIQTTFRVAASAIDSVQCVVPNLESKLFRGGWSL
jgi:hypothetical protein